jgi:hypothetical protein
MGIITNNDVAIFRYLSDKRKDLMAEMKEVASELKTSDDNRYLTILSAKLTFLSEIIEDICGVPRDTYGR